MNTYTSAVAAAPCAVPTRKYRFSWLRQTLDAESANEVRLRSVLTAFEVIALSAWLAASVVPPPAVAVNSPAVAVVREAVVPLFLTTQGSIPSSSTAR